MVRIKATVEYIETVIGFPVGLLLVMERVFDDCLLYDLKLKVSMVFNTLSKFSTPNVILTG